MFRTALGAGGGPKKRFDSIPRCSFDFRYRWCAQCECAGLIKEDRIELAERLQIDSAFDDRAVTGGASDFAENGKRRAGRDSARACHDDDRDCGSNVVSDEERK